MQVSGDGYEKLNDAIQGASYNYSYRSTKAEIIDYYKETYASRGTEGWKQHIVKDLAAQTGIKPKNLERRFDPSRINSPEKRNAAQYQELGKTLPQKKTPKDVTGTRARVTWSGTFYTYDSEKPRSRSFTTTLSPSQASAMRRGSFEPIFTEWGIPSGVITEIEVDKVDIDFL